MARREQVLRNKAEKLEVKGLENTEVTTQCLSAIEELLHDVYIIRRPESIDYYFRRNLIRVFNEIAKEIYGNCEDCPVVEGFGSFLMDIFSTKSDLDLSVNFRSNAVEFPREKKIQTLRKFAKKLYAFQRKGHVSSLQPIMNAKVPILKVADCGTGIECDISVENRDGIVKSKIIHIISSIDERFRKLSFLMKAWAKAHNINSSKDRTLSSLAIISLVAFHLQTRDPPILPPFSSILSDGTDPAVVAKTVQKFLNYGEKNKESLAELFMTLLIKLASVETLWPKGLCASTYEGLWISKKWDFKVGFISVEDFTDRSLNIARAVRKAEVTKIYKCINLSIRYIKAFLDGQIKVPKLKGFLFGPNSLPIPVANGTTSFGTSTTQPSIPLDPTQIKKIRCSAGWGGTSQDVPNQPMQKKAIASTNGWESTNSGGWEGSKTKGWDGADTNSWDRALTHTEGWGGLNTKSWGGTNTKSWESWGHTHVERWGGTNTKNWGGTNTKSTESWGGMNTKSSGDVYIGRGGTNIKSWGGADTKTTKSWGQTCVEGLGGTNGKSTKSWGGANIESWGQTHTKVWGGMDTLSRGRTHTEGWEGTNANNWGGMNTKSWGGMHTGSTSWGGKNTKTWGGTDTKSKGQTHTEGWGATNTKNWGGPNPKSWGGTNTKTWGGRDTKSMGQTHREGWGATNTKKWGGSNTKSWGGTNREGLGGTNTKTWGGMDTKSLGRTHTEGWGATKTKTWGGPNTKSWGGTKREGLGGAKREGLGGAKTEGGRGGTNTKSWGGTHAEGWGGTNIKRGTQTEGWGGGNSKIWGQTHTEGWGGTNTTTLRGSSTSGWGGHQYNGTTSSDKNP